MNFRLRDRTKVGPILKALDNHVTHLRPPFPYITLLNGTVRCTAVLQIKNNNNKNVKEIKQENESKCKRHSAKPGKREKTGQKPHRKSYTTLPAARNSRNLDRGTQVIISLRSGGKSFGVPSFAFALF